MQLARIPHLVDVVQLLGLGGVGRRAKPEHLARLDIGDPENEGISANLVGDEAVVEVGAAQVVEAAPVLSAPWRRDIPWIEE